MAADDLQVRSPEEAADVLATPSTETVAVDGRRDTEMRGATPIRGSDHAGAQRPPRLAAGIELIGEFEDSGFKQAPFIARRSDGQVVQMPDRLYRLAEQVDGQASLEQIADGFSHAIERQVQARDVQMLIDEQLRPLGIVAAPEGAPELELNKVDPLLSLKLRTAVVPDGVVRSLTTLFRPLFLAPVIGLVGLGMLGVDGWLFFVHGITQSLRHTLYQPALMLTLIGGVILATAFHEIGHATACRYGGAKPGVMGVGIYIVWPAFYTDITDAYRLGKRGRLRTDLGGMYFNAVFALIVAGLYAATSFAPLLLLIVLQNFAILQQALPLLRLDGYYILSDLTGVPDIFQRLRPILASFIPGRPADDRVTALKSWVRIVVSGYVLMIVAFLGVTVLALVINLPRIVATGYDSAALRFDAVGPAFSRGQSLRGVLDVIQMLFLILPGAGLAYTAVRVARRSTTGAYKWSSGHPGRQVTLGLAGAAAVALAAFSWWPNGEYRPLQPSERGTLAGLFHQVAALPTGRPSLTVQRQRQLGGAPTERQRQSLRAPQPAGRQGTQQRQPAPPQTTDTNPVSATTGTTTTRPTATSPGPAASGQTATTTPAESTSTQATTAAAPSSQTTTSSAATTAAAPQIAAPDSATTSTATTSVHEPPRHLSRSEPMRRVIASAGVMSVVAAGVILSLAATTPASGAPPCQPPTTTTTTSTSTTSTSTTTSSSTTPSPGPPTIPEPTGHPLDDNTVENCADRTAEVRSQLQVASTHGAHPDPVNFAYAYAHDCSTGCQAVAVSYQVVLQDQRIRAQTPQNVALAVNYRCDHCAVFAYADQYVVEVPHGTHLSAETQRQIEMIRRQADAAVKANLSFTDLDTKLRALASELRTDVKNGLQSQHAHPTDEDSSQRLKTSGQR